MEEAKKISKSEVKRFLFDTLGEGTSAHEEDDKTFHVLCQLMEANQSADHAAGQEILRYKEMTRELRQQACQLSDVVCAGAGKRQNLPYTLRRHLHALASIIDPQSPSDVSPESRLSIVTKLRQEVSELRNLADRKRQEASDLRKVLAENEKKLVAAAESAPAEYKSLNSKEHQLKKEVAYLGAKQQEYKKKICQVPTTEVDPVYTHEEIVAYHRISEELAEKQRALEEQLKPYHGLQPDEEDILEKLKQAKIELDTLEKEFQRKLSQDLATYTRLS